LTDERELEKQLKLVSKTGKYVVGRREVMSGLKGSKLLVWSTSANLPQTILDESRNMSIPAVRFSGNPVELGRACGIPFRVSIIAVKTQGDADLKSFANSTDYSSTVPSGIATSNASTVTESSAISGRTMAKEEEVKTTKKRKTAKKETKTEEAEPAKKKAASPRKKKASPAEDSAEVEKETETTKKGSKPKSPKRKASSTKSNEGAEEN
jgi:large subunit ribosomal protein L30e